MKVDQYGIVTAEITTPFNGRRITIRYVGYGAKIEFAVVDDKQLTLSSDNRFAKISKASVSSDITVIIRF